MPRPLKVGVLASGEGTTFEGLADAIANDAGSVRIAVVVSDRPAAPVLERARARGLPTAVVPVKGVAPEVWSERLSETLSAHGVELVVLAGFLPILPSNWVAQWRGRAINTHPSLLPRYGGHGMYGRHVHEAVLAAGDRESGVTVHLITDALDAGPPISQERAPVLPGDTPESLRQRLHPVEVALLAATVRRFGDGSLPLPYPGGDEREREPRVAPERRR
ncbi:MAG: phosphoribosylglycinamide formyltransferase [Thermoplasmata archaeon]